MIRFGLGMYLYAVMVLCISLGAHGELTADVVFSMLNSRMKTLEIVTFSLEASVKRINERLDNIEKLSDSLMQVNDNNIADSSEENVKSDSMNMKHQMMKAFASEKMFINNALSEYEGKFTEFQKTVKDQMDIMNNTLEASSVHLERRIEKNLASIETTYVYFEKKIEQNEEDINRSLQNLTVDSETKLQKAILQFEAAMTGTTREIDDIVESVAHIEENIRGKSNRIDNMDSRVSSLHSSQSEDISSLQSKLNTLENRQSSETSSVRRRVNKLENKRVGFTARLTKHLSNYSKNKIIVFDDVKTNHGGGYSDSTGKFTAPKSGLYLFQFNVEAYGSQEAHVSLIVDGYYKAEANVNNGPNFTGSNTAVAYMNTGDQAYVRTANNDPSYGVYAYRTSFTGVLIN